MSERNIYNLATALQASVTRTANWWDKYRLDAKWEGTKHGMQLTVQKGGEPKTLQTIPWGSLIGGRTPEQLFLHAESLALTEALGGPQASYHVEPIK